MTDIQMGCFGSVLLYDKSHAYCANCPIQQKCSVQVEENKQQINEALKKPVYEANGQFWAKGVTRTRERKAAALRQSTVAPKTPSRSSTPAMSPKPASKPAAPSTGEQRSPSEALADVNLPKKVLDELNRWSLKSIDLSAFNAKQNPFNDMPGCQFAEMLTKTVLSSDKVLSKRELRAAIREFQLLKGLRVWSDASLQSNINIVTRAFHACGYNIVQEYQ